MNRMDQMKVLHNKLYKKLIVSCQALDDEPLHSSYIMGRMAYAAFCGGASGIRSNSVSDIHEIKYNVDLPIIGIIKKVYNDSDVYITPTISEIDQLVKEGVDIIAIDATNRIRPNKIKLEELFTEARKKYPDQLFMADTSCLEEGIIAEKLGFDFIGTTMIGYTDYTKGNDPLTEIERYLKVIKAPIIGEGNLDTPSKALKALELGVFAVVVGSAITRPQLITKKFCDKIDQLK